MKYAVCPRCRGEGSHVNPSVDGHGITAEEMDELGPEFLDDYMGGVYDVRCEQCHGDRVVPACRADDCNEPVVGGKHYYDDPISGAELSVPYIHCVVHLSDLERECWQERLDYQDEVAAERRMGA